MTQWANRLDPEWIIKSRDFADIPVEQRDLIGQIALALRRAFEAQDEYERDWLLAWARMLNAQAVIGADPLQKAVVKAGGIPMAKDSTMERAIFHVQKKLAHKMAVCKAGCSSPCFFQAKAKQQFCSRACRLESIRASKRRSFHAHSGWRGQRG